MRYKYTHWRYNRGRSGDDVTLSWGWSKLKIVNELDDKGLHLSHPKKKGFSRYTSLIENAYAKRHLDDK